MIAESYVDGAWLKDLSLGGIGIAIRDSQGKCMIAATRIIKNVFSPLQIEVLAVREGLELVIERGLHKIVLESDSLQTILAIRDPSMNISPIGPIIEDAKFLLTLVTEVTAVGIEKA